MTATKAVVTAVAFAPDSKTVFLGDYQGHVISIDIKSKATKTLL